MKVKIHILKITLFALVLLSNNTYAVIYKVKKNDTLSGVLYAHGVRPLYGKNSKIQSIIALNRDKIKDNGNFINVGELIDLPLEVEAQPTFVEVIQPVDQNVAEQSKDVVEETTPLIKTIREPSDEYPNSHFAISPKLPFLKLTSTNNVFLGGTTVTALSKQGYGLDLAWQVDYDNLINFFGDASVEHFRMYQDSKYKTNKSDITRIQVGVGGSYGFTPDLRIKSKLSMRTVSFLDLKSPFLINLESMAIPEISVGIEKVIFTKKQLSGKVDMHLITFLPGTRGEFKSKTGIGGGIGVEVLHQNKGLFLGYDYRSMKINDIDNKESTLNFGFKFLTERFF